MSKLVIMVSNNHDEDEKTSTEVNETGIRLGAPLIYVHVGNAMTVTVYDIYPDDPI